MKSLIALYLALAVWLAGFAAAAVTAGSPAAVTVGALGLLATLGAIVVRLDAEAPHTRHRTAVRR